MGSFIAAGPTNKDRSSSTATTLPNGRVLLSGSQGDGLKTTEVHDPVANTFIDEPNMNVERTEATGVLLTNGKVLIAGGDDLIIPSLFGFRHPGTSELYDPTNNTITGGPPMIELLHAATAILLHDGRVLVIGGERWPGNPFGFSSPVERTEFYDPTTNKFTVEPALNVPRGRDCRAVPLPSGRVLITGGTVKPDFGTELYDPVMNKIALAPIMAAGGAATNDTPTRIFTTATLLPNGQVLISRNKRTELYDPTTNSFTAGPVLADSVGPLFAAVPLRSGKVLLFGWFEPVGESYGSYLFGTQLYDLTTNTFAVGPTFGDAVIQFVVSNEAVLNNGSVLVTFNYNGATLYRP